MTNALYPLGKKHVMQKEIDLTANTSSDRLKTRLVRISGSAAHYTYSAAHEFLSDIDTAIATADGGSSTTSDQNVGACTIVSASGNAVLTPASPSVTHPTMTSTGSLASPGVDQFAVILYHWTGAAATSQLLAYFDTGPGLPIVPDGGDETVQWNTGTDKIYSL